MKKLVQLSALIVLSALALSAGDWYKLTGVRRIDKDIYKADGGLLIETKYCYEYIYGEDALLQYGGKYDVDNKIVFPESNTACDVKGVYKN